MEATHGQLKSHSILESVVNVLVGLIVALISQVLVFPLFGIIVGIDTNLKIACIFTIISIARSYCLRRIFNYWWRIRVGRS